MTKALFFFLTAIFLMGCNPRNKEASHQDTEDSIQLPLGCYAMVENGNIIALKLTSESPTISGDLIYALAEKDKNQGFFSGFLEGDRLTGMYTFKSEGVESKREVSFLVKDMQLIEGFGEIELNGGTAKFKDAKTLDFNGSIVLKPIDCDSLERNCVFEFGTVKSNLLGTCLFPSDIEVKLNPLKDGAKTPGPLAYLAFDQDLGKAELFLPQTQEGIVLNKTAVGTWENETYLLSSWKGYVLQQNGIAIYGGQ